MDCPRDQQPLRRVVRRRVVTDVCDACEGKWLDEGELEQLFLRSSRVRTTEDRLARSLASVLQEGSADAACDEPTLACPRCADGMRKVRFRSGDAQVIADRCGSCKGFWFDSGEQLATFGLLESNLPVRPAVFVAVLVAALGIAFAFWIRS